MDNLFINEYLYKINMLFTYNVRMTIYVYCMKKIEQPWETSRGTERATQVMFVRKQHQL